MGRGGWQWLRARDPGWYALRRAARAAVVVPVDFAIGSEIVGDAQVATFAAFGSFALLLFVNFPGDRTARLGAYLLLGLAGAGLITVGTLVATPDWLAVAAMALVTFAVLFAGVVSSVLNAGTQAALLAFILAVMLPGVRGDLPDRLLGWGIAFAVSVPVALLVWPPADRDVLRIKAAATMRALAGMLRLEQPADRAGDPLVALHRAMGELRTAFRISATRTAALSTGARLLIRLVDELEWLATAVMNACADAPADWPEQGRRLREAAAQLLSASAETLDHDGSGPPAQACLDLEICVAVLDQARAAIAEEALTELRGTTGGRTDVLAAGEFERPLYAAHELGYAVALVAGTVSSVAAADSRSWWQRLAGRRPAMHELGGAVTVAEQVAGGHLDRHSVWLQSSVRGAAGLALAVLISRVVDVQNAFWIGLGALSVLRSNALSTGATVVRALLGTALGFVVGGAAVALIGTNHAVLWTLLPLVIIVAASAPAVISFVAGQAAFTVFTIILFNIIAPAGWRVGVVRIEDVALGCAASLAAGFLFWPRGAAAALGAAYAEAYRSAADYLRQSIETLTGRRPGIEAGMEATAAANRLDDALRQYLAEQGAKHVPLESVATLATGAARLRLAGTAIARLGEAAPDGRTVPEGDVPLNDPADVLVRRGEHVTDWYARLADGFARRDAPFPSVEDLGRAESFLDVVLPVVEGCGDSDRAARAEQLLWSGQYLGDVDQLRPHLLEPAAQVSTARSRPWWQR
jgi:hypothetical protein